MTRTRWHRSMWLFATLASSICHAQAAFPAKELTLKGIYGERRAESNLYCIGAGKPANTKVARR